MSGGQIVRHDCGRLIIYGSRCTCERALRPGWSWGGVK